MTFRLPAAIREALQRAAEAERRSLSSMAVLILEDGLTARGFLKASNPQRSTKRS